MPDISVLVDERYRPLQGRGVSVDTYLQVLRNDKENRYDVFLRVGDQIVSHIVGSGDNRRAALITAKANLKWALDTLTELEP